ncbi:unnamed protein product [Fraxinus pennsylvanica]|uniref:ubiquitinyl hydrolase 1 n=1 Tax=Fraxinus pennsylvanica TaxID=56036 RepID=A0AAD2E573_9LAMI|nr:unnamed protein product [Fraxinus pennsylvanica]
MVAGCFRGIKRGQTTHTWKIEAMETLYSIAVDGFSGEDGECGRCRAGKMIASNRHSRVSVILGENGIGLTGLKFGGRECGNGPVCSLFFSPSRHPVKEHVLEKALEVWDLQVIPLNSPVSEPAQIDPELENAFICHLRDHWFCIRKVNGEWYDFDSLYAAPEHLSKFYLLAYLDSLKGFGWSIFLVKGKFPKECPITFSKSSNGYGQWLSPEDAERITKSCNSASRSSPGVNLSDPYLQHGQPEILSDNEDEDLKAAIAASLIDSSQEIKTEASITENENENSNEEKA